MLLKIRNALKVQQSNRQNQIRLEPQSFAFGQLFAFIAALNFLPIYALLMAQFQALHALCYRVNHSSKIWVIGQMLPPVLIHCTISVMVRILPGIHIEKSFVHVESPSRIYINCSNRCSVLWTTFYAAYAFQETRAHGFSRVVNSRETKRTFSHFANNCGIAW